MGEWYRIGLAAGIGVGIGVLLSGALAPRRAGVAAALVAAAAAAAGVGFLIDDWTEAVAGALGAFAGTLGAGQLVRGTLRRGGTRGGTAALLAGAGVALGALALIPVVGYLEAVVVPALALRLRRRGGERYAGLRILARD